MRELNADELELVSGGYASWPGSVETATTRSMDYMFAFQRTGVAVSSGIPFISGSGMGQLDVGDVEKVLEN